MSGLFGHVDDVWIQEGPLSTLMRSRPGCLAFSFISFAASIVGTVSGFSIIFIPRLLAILRLTVKHDSSKCMPQRIACLLPGVHLGLAYEQNVPTAYNYLALSLDEENDELSRRVYIGHLHNFHHLVHQLRIVSRHKAFSFQCLPWVAISTRLLCFVYERFRWVLLMTSKGQNFFARNRVNYGTLKANYSALEVHI